jgi:tetratricopeptide (TPR) repeat protein
MLGRIPGADLMSSLAFEEILRAASSAKSQSAGNLSRVEVDLAGSKALVYLVNEKGGPKVLGGSDTYGGVGRYLFALLAKKDDKTAQQLLDWVAADIAANGRMRTMAAIWGQSLPRTREEMGLAAALLADGSADSQAVPALKKCLPSTQDGQLACDFLLIDAYRRAKAWTDMEDHARAWVARSGKQNSIPYIALATALAHRGKLDDADQAVKDGNAVFPDDRLLLGQKVELYYARGQYAKAMQEVDAIASKPNATAMELNNSAWSKLVEGSDLEKAAFQARRALQLSPDDDNVLNTAGVIAAERNELVEAKEHLDKSTGKDEPLQPDWYVHGRILEQLGLRDDAISAYKKAVAKPTDSLTVDAYQLAQKRLKALGVTK